VRFTAPLSAELLARLESKARAQAGDEPRL
jgi:hypothetical protein